MISQVEVKPQLRRIGSGASRLAGWPCFVQAVDRLATRGMSHSVGLSRSTIAIATAFTWLDWRNGTLFTLFRSRHARAAKWHRLAIKCSTLWCSLTIVAVSLRSAPVLITITIRRIS